LLSYCTDNGSETDDELEASPMNMTADEAEEVEEKQVRI
jgi:hypothetical protein